MPSILPRPPRSGRRAMVAALLFSVALGLGGPTAAHARDKVGLVLAQHHRNKVLDDQAINVTTDAFLASRRFTVLEREALDSVMQEKSFKGFIGDSEGAEIGQLLGLRWVAMFSYTEEPYSGPGGGPSESYEISVRMIDVASGQVLYTITSRPDATDLGERAEGKVKNWFSNRTGGLTAAHDPSLAGAGRRLLQSILTTFPPEGYVVEVIGQGEVVIDLGVDDGLSAGDMLEVFTVGEPFLHPITGEQLPGRTTVQGKLKVVDVRAGLSTCKIKNGAQSMAIGSRVRFQVPEGLFERFGR